MKVIYFILKLLGTLWCTLNNIGGLFSVLVSGTKFLYMEDWVLFYATVPGKFADTKMRAGIKDGIKSAAAVTIGQFVIIREDVFTRYTQDIIDTLKTHERRHVWQQWVMGIFQPIAYLIHCAILRLQGQNMYHDNFLERDARKAAGEPV